MKMKKIIVGSILTIAATIALGQYVNCWQQYVCGGGGCSWVTICR
jgi:predicted small secreted protein